MDKQFYEKVFSAQRMEKYFRHYENDDEKAIIHYQSNIELSEAFYSILSMFEVALSSRIFMVMGWLHKDLPRVAEKIDRAPQVLNEVKKRNIA